MKPVKRGLGGSIGLGGALAVGSAHCLDVQVLAGRQPMKG